MDYLKEFEGLSFKVRNFMCFGSDPQGFDQILPINIIIGRNNTGKTALIEMLHYLSDPMGQDVTIPTELFHGDATPEFHISTKVAVADIERAYSDSLILNGIPNDTPYKRALFAVGETASIVFDYTLKTQRTEFPACLRELPSDNPTLLVRTPLKNKRLVRISSERDIVRESANTTIYLKKNGEGATRILHEIMNSSRFAKLPEAHGFLNEINNIVEPDLRFTKIDVKKDQNDNWEIFLTEAGKHPISLSNLGSGLKTIILVLLNLHLAPKIIQDNRPRYESDYCYAFEEIENFLHPAIQRRLLSYLKNFALTNKCPIFISSHSNIAIDMFSKDSCAQIIHVTSDGKASRVERASTYLQHKGIIDDLDVRASDLLQSNGVIWVEGPSDRIYLNRWIELASNASLKEGAHYQIVFYGGRLLSHLSGASPDESANLVNILRVNRNAAIIIDSDKRDGNDMINATKQRLVKEVEALNGIVWVTQGKEIENYIPLAVIRKIYPETAIEAPSQYDDFFDYLNSLDSGKGQYFASRKPMLAEQVAENFTKEDISTALDLEAKVTEICKEIRKWNNLPDF